MGEGPGIEELADAELARRVASGGPEAAPCEAELCRRLGPRLRLYGLRHLRDGPAADDLAQDVLVLVLERLRAGRVREPERLASFALGACRLVVRNQRRGTRRRQELLDRYPVARTDRTAPDTTWLDRGRLARCLGELVPRDRTVLVLTFYAEKSSADIARSLALTEENVRTVRHRAFARLRGCVQGSAA